MDCGTLAEVFSKSSVGYVILEGADQDKNLPLVLPAIVLEQRLTAARVIAEQTTVFDDQFTEFLAGLIVH